MLFSAVKPASRSVTVKDWVARQSPDAWISFKRRDGTNGSLRGEFLHARVWLWDGEEEMPRCWHPVAWRADGNATETKYVLSNAVTDIPLLGPARMAAPRFWIGRALLDARGAASMGGYQMLGWPGWHRHMALVMPALFFMLQQRVLLAEELPLLSAEDIALVL